MKKIFKKIFYLLVLSLLVYAPNAMAVACYKENGDLIIDNGSKITVDGQIPNIISTVVLVLKIAVPVLLIIMGMIDMAKGVIAQKDDEIKKGQQIFFKRLIAGALVFFIITIVQFAVNFANNDTDGNIMGCAKCFINGLGKCGTVDAVKDTWTCNVDGYDAHDDQARFTIQCKVGSVIYIPKDGTDETITSVDSDFVPKKYGECPAAGYIIYVTNKGGVSQLHIKNF